MAEGSTPIEIFCCYAREDETWLRKLETHLSPLERQGLISLWHDRLITPGTNWTRAIDTRLETASVILLLVSANFMASDYCYSIEMKRALERHEAGEAQVIPILVRPVDWRDAPFAHLRALPTDAKPITTWRMQDRALTDITTGIRRAIEDMPLLTASAPRTALPKIWTIPYQRNPFFLGREAQLALVRQHLQASQAVAFSQPQAISGLGGVGKSQIALEYAYRYHQDYQAVLWVRAESTEALVSSYVAIAMELRLPEREEKKQEIIIQAVKGWLQTYRGWLLILDNADELALLLDFLPPTPGGHLLLTTRATAIEGLARRLEIEAFLPEQGALLLLRRSGLIAPEAELSQASAQERDVALQISQELGGLPLALDQAGAYLEATGTNLADYWLIYQQHRADLLAERRALIPDHPAPVATTWSLSFERVKEKNEAAAELLYLCAFLSPDVIPEEILTAGTSFPGSVLSLVTADALLLNQAIEVLRAYSLVRRDPKGKTLSIHRLVQAVLQDALEEEEKRIWGERAILAINAAFPEVKHETWPLCERMLTQAQSTVPLVERYPLLEAGQLFYRTARYLYQRGKYEQAEPLFQRALHIQEQQLGSEDLQVASSLQGLGILYTEQGKYEQAEPLFQRTLRIRELQLGPEHPDVASPLTHLGNLYYLRGKYEQAELFYQRTLRIRELQSGPEDLLVASSLQGLAILHSERGKYEQAEPLFQRTLRIRELQLGPEHPDVAHSLNNLGNLYYLRGKYEQAEPFYQRALRIRELQLGPEHPDVAGPLQGLATLYYQWGKYEQAEPLFQRTLRIRELQLGPEHPDVAHSLTWLAILHSERGKYEQAEPLFQRALRIQEQQLGPEHSQVAYPLVNLAQSYAEQGKYEQAEPLFQRALGIWEQQLGPEHSQVAYSLNGLGSLYAEQGKYEQAEPLCLRALRIQEQQLGPDHPDTAETLHSIARFREAQGRDKEASICYARALAIREQALGTQHLKTRETHTRLIALLHAMGQHEEAAKLEESQSES